MYMMIKNEKGLLTLEAAMVLPIFVFFLLFLYGLMMMFSGQEMIAHAMFQSSESLAFDSYATDKFSTGSYESAETLIKGMYESFLTNKDSKYSSSTKWYENKEETKKVSKERFLGYFCGGDKEWSSSFLSITGVKGGLDGIDFSGTYIDSNRDLHLKAKYKQYFLFDFGGNVDFDREVEVVAHMW